MRGQIRGLSQASTNVETGISLVQTADGAMQEVNDILNRIRILGVQAVNDTNTDEDREQLQKEINMQLPQIDEQSLGITEVDVSTHDKASASLEIVDEAVEYVNGERARMGAYQNRMEHAVQNLDNQAENLQAAESRIRDLDMAWEILENSKNKILQQAGAAVLSNGTTIAQNVLGLLS